MSEPLDGQCEALCRPQTASKSLCFALAFCAGLKKGIDSFHKLVNFQAQETSMHFLGQFGLQDKKDGGQVFSLAPRSHNHPVRWNTI